MADASQGGRRPGARRRHARTCPATTTTLTTRLTPTRPGCTSAGVTVAIRSKSGGPSAATGGRNLPYEAATAVAFGLPEDVALKAVTLTPAQILGVADRVGSLEAGKRANLVVTAGHILQPTTPVLALFIGGKP